MDLMFNFSSEKWENNPNLKSTDCPEGYQKFHIMSAKEVPPKGSKKWSYAVADMQDNQKQVWLEGAGVSKNPLAGIGNIGMKIGGCDDHQIIGLLAYDDCIEFKA